MIGAASFHPTDQFEMMECGARASNLKSQYNTSCVQLSTELYQTFGFGLANSQREQI